MLIRQGFISDFFIWNVCIKEAVPEPEREHAQLLIVDRLDFFRGESEGLVMCVYIYVCITSRDKSNYVL